MFLPPVSTLSHLFTLPPPTFTHLSVTPSLSLARGMWITVSSLSDSGGGRPPNSFFVHLWDKKIHFTVQNTKLHSPKNGKTERET